MSPFLALPSPLAPSDESLGEATSPVHVALPASAKRPRRSALSTAARLGRMVAAVVVSALVSALLGACGPHLPAPKTSAHRDDEFAEVPYPPPAIKADEVTPSPSPDAVWIDGEWRWQGRRWTWSHGGWITPPAGATFARWDTRRSGATLLYAPGTFHLADGSAVAIDTLRPGASRTRPEVQCVPTTLRASATSRSPAPSAASPAELVNPPDETASLAPTPCAASTPASEP